MARWAGQRLVLASRWLRPMRNCVHVRWRGPRPPWPWAAGCCWGATSARARRRWRPLCSRRASRVSRRSPSVCQTAGRPLPPHCSRGWGGARRRRRGQGGRQPTPRLVAPTNLC